MNPPVAEAAKPAPILDNPPQEQLRPDIIAFFKDEAGERTPITKDCVEVIFVRDRPHLDHCLVTLESQDKKVFLKPRPETVEHLLQADASSIEVADIPVETVTMYANFMSRSYGSDPMPELIPQTLPQQHVPGAQTL